MKNAFYIIFISLFICCHAYGVNPEWSTEQWNKFISAIKTIETKNTNGIKGDNGEALGIAQIHKDCFSDAKEYDKTIKGKWEDCLTDIKLSEKVLQAYIKRYAPKNATPEDCAKIWNGGPKGYLKKSTIKYAERFKKVYYN